MGTIKRASTTADRAHTGIGTSATVEVRHNGLTCNEAGWFSEIPDLLDAFEKLRADIQRHLGARFDVSMRPSSKQGAYGFYILEKDQQQDALLGPERLHALPEQISKAWATIVTNAQSDRPKPFAMVGVSETQFAILKALGCLSKFEVEAILTTEEGRTTIFPVINSKLLSGSGGDTPDGEHVSGLITGIDVTKSKRVLVRLDHVRWIRVLFATYTYLCERSSRGVILSGRIEVVDGAWTMEQGEFFAVPPTMEMPF